MIKLNVLPAKPKIDNSWTIKQIVDTWQPYTWEKVFKDAELELYDISEIIENDKKLYKRYYPDTENLFKAFELTKLSKVKVVIIGQDPYHSCNSDGTPQAQGLSFSVKKYTRIPPSLINIYKEIKKCYPDFVAPTHGDLSYWAQQGVLLLNSCLTVRPNEAGSHKQIWLPFIKKVINAILDENPEAIFVLWGNGAKKVKTMLGQRATILEAAHPSPLSAFRGFFGCKHFLQINEILTELDKSTIDWQL